MKCPICDIDMRIAEREGVEIDYCPQCRGVWLDRGELEKLIAQVESTGYGERGRHDRDDDDDHHHDDRRASTYRDEEHYEDAYRRKSESKYKGKRKEGFLSQLFDVFGD
jgi:uncharacterized protein